MISIDGIPGGALIGNYIEVAKASLEEIASNNYYKSNERDTPKKSYRKYAMTL